MWLHSASGSIEHARLEVKGPLYEFFVNDHRRLERLLNRAAAKQPKFDMEAYGEFRSGLLRHIKMEENVILPAAQKARGGTPLAVASRLRTDHGALVALMVPPPSPGIVKAIRSILATHNRLEEGQGGMYDLCERMAGDNIDDLLSKVKTVPEVPLHPHNTSPRILEATRRAVERAGYRLDGPWESENGRKA